LITAVDTRAQILDGAARLRELDDTINRELPKRNDEWRRACAGFHRSFDSSAFPGGLERHLKALKMGDAYAVELAVTFLEVDAMFHRSGYIKEEIIRRLKKAELSPKQVKRLGNTIVRVVDDRDCREFRRFCQLARQVGTAELVRELRSRAEGANADVSRRAKWVLDAMDVRPEAS
jgi:hypothetical protein